MKTDEYNGWTNYETWAVNLWIGNDQGSQEYWQEQAEDTYKHSRDTVNPNFTQTENAVLGLSKSMESEIKDADSDINPLADSNGLYSDLLNAALSEVNWHEIAEHMIEDVDKEEEVAV